MISELSKSVKATLYDRVASPVSGMFLLSWVVWNWKLCLILFFSDYDVDRKITLISANYLNNYDNFYYPVMSTAVLVFLYPLISVLPAQVWEWANAYKSKIKHRYSLEVPLTVAQSIAIRQELQQEKLQLNGIVDEFRLRYEHEKTISAELSQQMSTLQAELNRYKEDPQLVVESLADNDEFSAAFSISTWHADINNRILGMNDGQKTTLKELIPQADWLKVSETNRKMIGKQFKQMVDRGDFIGLQALPEKTSSNEQLYVKVM
ncbi:single-stranded DNA-binding protein [Geomonas nitrogeniifigens]|uniref:Single-stranded DNA-binding protein n=1 Tax=Geomonas diazotrophica TaxID=2843197 RepID=A0ABX8JK31_9BACT|nr:DUF1413 domain-containing protein [Geomonas nitrogeniifigens]QWV98658.1 single-stranded DNA-binding protein [Geomonas nitrogeniifigens]